MTCKGCNQDVEFLSGAGFCSNGICSIMETGYLMGLQDVTAQMAEEARAAQRIGPVSVGVLGDARGEMKTLKWSNDWP